jgi:hypothetical protein
VGRWDDFDSYHKDLEGRLVLAELRLWIIQKHYARLQRLIRNPAKRTPGRDLQIACLQKGMNRICELIAQLIEYMFFLEEGYYPTRENLSIDDLSARDNLQSRRQIDLRGLFCTDTSYKA